MAVGLFNRQLFLENSARAGTSISDSRLGQAIYARALCVLVEEPEEVSARNIVEFYRDELLCFLHIDFLGDRSDPVNLVLKKYGLVESFRMIGVYRFRPTEKALKLLRECAHPHWINI